MVWQTGSIDWRLAATRRGLRHGRTKALAIGLALATAAGLTLGATVARPPALQRPGRQRLQGRNLTR